MIYTHFNEIPKQNYQIIYADPPWQYGRSQFYQKYKGMAGQVTSAARLYYNDMSESELVRLPIHQIADVNALLFMWTSSPHLRVAMNVMDEWSFDYKTIAFVWDKQRLNPSAYTMSQCEIVLVGKRGNIPKPRGARNIQQFLSQKRGYHSEKPEEIRRRIAVMFPEQRKIELFGRQNADGWDVWGNQVTYLYQSKFKFL